MPQLPSGRYVMLRDEKLGQLIDQAKEGVGVHRAMALLEQRLTQRLSTAGLTRT